MDLANAPDLRHSEPQSAPISEGAGDGLRAIAIEEARDLRFLAKWNALIHRAIEPNPFYEPWFLLPSLDAFGHGARVTVYGYFEKGVLAGLLPLARPGSYYGYRLPHLSSWLHANAFCGAPLIAQGSQERFWTALLAHLDRAPGSAFFFHCPQLPAEGPANAALSRVLAGQGRLAATVHSQVRAMLASDAAPQDYLATSLSTKHRKDLRRQRRRLAEQGDLAVERFDDMRAIEDWTLDFLTLESAGWKGEAGTALAKAQATRSLFTQVLHGAASAGRLERLALTLNGSRIAMLASFVSTPGAYSFKTAFDEDYAAYSPGMLLQLENLSSLANPAIEWTDSCAAPGHPMIDRLWSERRTLVSRNIAIGGRLRQTFVKPLMAYEGRNKGTP